MRNRIILSSLLVMNGDGPASETWDPRDGRERMRSMGRGMKSNQDN